MKEPIKLGAVHAKISSLSAGALRGSDTRVGSSKICVFAVSPAVIPLGEGVLAVCWVGCEQQGVILAGLSRPCPCKPTSSVGQRYRKPRV